MERLTVEDKIMGRKEPLPKTELQLKAFTHETKYEVYAEGSDNKKTVDGAFVGKILSMDNKTLITSGETEIKANGLVIKRLETVIEKTPIVDETPKPRRRRTK
ncbi:MAG: hypothetical protein ACI4S3_06075 [Candidatus Gastranaerophilaceae bacterium]